MSGPISQAYLASTKRKWFGVTNSVNTPCRIGKAILGAFALMLLACGDSATTVDEVRDAAPDSIQTPEDAGTPPADSGPQLCARDLDCSDDVFCNGAERCEPGDGADEHGCRAATEARCLPGQTCDEEVNRCLTQCDVSGDADGDGDDSIDCGGTDCDDADARRFPGNAEVCDNEHHDEDCDPMTFGFRDQDADGFPDAMCCNLDADEALLCGTDCDDQNGIVHPTEAESCDGLDNDCDTRIDEGVMRRFWPDVDGDGFGDDTAEPVENCMPPDDYVENGTDCDDNEARRNPSAPDVCDAVDDNDCNPETHPFDSDGDGVDDEECGGTDCDDDDVTIYPGAVELCDGIDSDCSEPNPWQDQDDEDADEDGHAPIGMCIGDRFPADDCDDTINHVHAGAPEHCNGIDDDCDPSTPDPINCSDPTLTAAFVLSRGDGSRLRHAAVDANGHVYTLIVTRYEGATIGSQTVDPGWHLASFTEDGVMRWRTELARLEPGHSDEWGFGHVTLSRTGELVFIFAWNPRFGSSTITVHGTAYSSGPQRVFTGTLSTATGSITAAYEITGAEDVRATSAAPAPDADLLIGLRSAANIEFPDGSSAPSDVFRLNFDGDFTAVTVSEAVRQAYGRSSDCASEIVSDISSDRFYFGYNCVFGGELYAFDLQGAQQWTADGLGTPRAIAPSGEVVNSAGRIGGIHLTNANGDPVWEQPVALRNRTVALAPESVFAAGGYNGQYFGLAESGSTILKLDHSRAALGVYQINATGTASTWLEQLTYVDGSLHAFTSKFGRGSVVEGAQTLVAADQEDDAWYYLRLAP